MPPVSIKEVPSVKRRIEGRAEKRIKGKVQKRYFIFSLHEE